MTRFLQLDWFLDVLRIHTEHGSEKQHLWELSKRNKQWFSMLSTVLDHSRIVIFSTFEYSTASRALKHFIRAGNNPVVS